MKRAVLLLVVLLTVLGGAAWFAARPSSPGEASTRLAFIHGTEDRGERYLIVDYIDLKTGEEADRWLQAHDPSCANSSGTCTAPHGFVLANDEEKIEPLPLTADAQLIVSIQGKPTYQMVDFPVFAAKISQSSGDRPPLYDRVPFAIDIDASGKAVLVREQAMPE